MSYIIKLVMNHVHGLFNFDYVYTLAGVYIAHVTTVAVGGKQKSTHSELRWLHVSVDDG